MKEKIFLVSLISRADLVMIQEHKLRVRLQENLGSRLMLGCANWVPLVARGERSWINPNSGARAGVGILLSNKYIR